MFKARSDVCVVEGSCAAGFNARARIHEWRMAGRTDPAQMHAPVNVAAQHREEGGGESQSDKHQAHPGEARRDEQGRARADGLLVCGFRGWGEWLVGARGDGRGAREHPRTHPYMSTSTHIQACACRYMIVRTSVWYKSASTRRCVQASMERKARQVKRPRRKSVFLSPYTRFMF